jgi:hypothetical protein
MPEGIYAAAIEATMLERRALATPASPPLPSA